MTHLNEPTVDVLGHQITTVLEQHGEPHVPLKELCGLLGLNYKNERRRRRNTDRFEGRDVSVPGENGKSHKIFCLSEKMMPTWLFLVDPDKVRPEIRATLLEYKDEAGRYMGQRLADEIGLSRRVHAEEIESGVRESLYRSIQQRFPDSCDTRRRRDELLLTEFVMFVRFGNQHPHFRDIALECIEVAIKKYESWVADFAGASHQAFPEAGS